MGFNSVFKGLRHYDPFNFRNHSPDIGSRSRRIEFYTVQTIIPGEQTQLSLSRCVTEHYCFKDMSSQTALP